LERYDAVDDESRSALRLVEGSPQILIHHAEREELAAIHDQLT